MSAQLQFGRDPGSQAAEIQSLSSEEGTRRVARQREFHVRHAAGHGSLRIDEREAEVALHVQTAGSEHELTVRAHPGSVLPELQLRPPQRVARVHRPTAEAVRTPGGVTDVPPRKLSLNLEPRKQATRLDKGPDTPFKSRGSEFRTQGGQIHEQGSAGAGDTKSPFTGVATEPQGVELHTAPSDVFPRDRQPNGGIQNGTHHLRPATQVSVHGFAEEVESWHSRLAQVQHDFAVEASGFNQASGSAQGVCGPEKLDPPLFVLQRHVRQQGDTARIRSAPAVERGRQAKLSGPRVQSVTVRPALARNASPAGPGRNAKSPAQPLVVERVDAAREPVGADPRPAKQKRDADLLADLAPEDRSSNVHNSP